MNKRLEGRCIRLAARLLKIASDDFSCHGCNDFNDDILSIFDKYELQEIDEDIARWNGDKTEHDKDRLPFVHNDFILMSYLAATVLQHAADLLD